MSDWSILYRGPLSSCNYSCDYCPFAKTMNSAAELRDDAARLSRFVEWVAGRTERIGILFTPWGEALIHRTYQEAMTRLSWMANVRRVAIQTNLSCRTQWLADCNRECIALWTTYHPTQVSRARFLAKCAELDEIGVRYSVGVVGFKNQLAEIRTLRAELNPNTYLWINAYKREPDYYSEADLAAFQEIDPWFRINARRHPSLGKSCRAGASAFTVDGEGTARRCHFIPQPIGNIYELEFERNLRARPCSNETCGCHIGYVHMEELQLDTVFGDGILERIPISELWDSQRRELRATYQLATLPQSR